jgi:hypothetical protein
MSNTPLVIDQKVMKEQFIAIRYMFGAGGNFMDAWLTASKLNLSNIVLNEYGSAHSAYKEFLPFRLPLTKTPTPSTNSRRHPPYFSHTEYRDLSIISSMFYKVINMSYELDDCDELELCFLGKLFFESVDKFPSVYVRHHEARQKYYEPIESTNTILNVTWKELFHGDADALIERLKMFTSLTNIKKEYLLEWREKTKLGMIKTENKIVKNKDLITL